MLTSSVGKTIEHDYDQEYKIINNSKFEKYSERNEHQMKSCDVLGAYKFVTTTKETNTQYGYQHCGAMVLSMSKRIMNEVMCTAEDNDVEIYYQDTDSMHLNVDDIDTLKDAYRCKYHRELEGKQLGQFHTDFKSEYYGKRNTAVLYA